MLQKTVVRLFVVAMAAGMLVGAGCKKKAQKPSGTSAKSAMASDMQAPSGMRRAAARPGARRATHARTAPRGPAWKPGSLPVPADAALVRLNLKAARASALYKTFEPKIKAWMDKNAAKEEVLKAMVTKCGVNPLTSVDEVVVGVSLGSSAKGDIIFLVKGSFDTAKALACMAPMVKKDKVKDMTIAGKKGAVYKDKKGEQFGVLPVDAHTVLFAGGKMLAKLGDLLGGKAPSITGTTLFKQYGSKVSADTLVAVLVPNLPASVTGKMPLPVLKGLKSLAVMLSLPAGGLDIKAVLDLGDKDKADKLAKALPMLIGVAKAKLGALGNTIVQNFKSKADGTSVKLSLVLSKADFEKVVGMAKGMLGKR